MLVSNILLNNISIILLIIIIIINTFYKVTSIDFIGNTQVVWFVSTWI